MCPCPTFPFFFKSGRFSSSNEAETSQWDVSRRAQDGSFTLWCRVKWRLYRKHTRGTLVPLICGMEKKDHQGRRDKQKVVSCSPGETETDPRGGKETRRLSCSAPAEINNAPLVPPHAAGACKQIPPSHPLSAKQTALLNTCSPCRPGESGPLCVRLLFNAKL